MNDMDKKFKSRRPENKTKDHGEKAEDHYEKVRDFKEEKFLRRYRFAHLRNDSNVPMSIRNVDRHGLVNLTHDKVKALDRLKIPPYLLYALFLTCFFYLTAVYFENEEL